jgi:hypothetical protein
VQGQPAEEWLIMRYGVLVVLYQHDDDTTALLAGIHVVEGRVAGDGAMVCPGYGCPATPTTAQQGTVATANRVRVERTLQGSIAAGMEIEVRQLGVPVAEGETAQIAALHPGERVLGLRLRRRFDRPARRLRRRSDPARSLRGRDPRNLRRRDAAGPHRPGPYPAPSPDRHRIPATIHHAAARHRRTSDTDARPVDRPGETVER